MKYLIEKGFMDDSQKTVSGMTIAKNLEKLPGLTDGQKIILPVEAPIKKTGHLQILYGNIAPEGSGPHFTLRFSE